MNFTRLHCVVISLLFLSAIFTASVAAWVSNDWAGLTLNLGTELAGAIIVYVIIEVVLGRLENNIIKKNDLIFRLRSNVDDVVTLASEELYATGWLFDGSLKFTNLSNIKLPNANLSKADLTGANLSKADLTSANLSEIILTRANLKEANLAGANLVGRYGQERMLLDKKIQRDYLLFYMTHYSAYLNMADLSKTNLSGANLRGVDLTGANMRNASLRDADLGRARLVNSNLENADLTNANLEKAIYNKGTIWSPNFDPQKVGAIYEEDSIINSKWGILRAVWDMMWMVLKAEISQGRRRRYPTNKNQ